MNIGKFKKLFVVIGILGILGMLGCSKKEEVKVYDFSASELTSELSQKLSFTDTIAEVEDQTLINQYGLEEELKIKDLSAYMSTAATTEEIAVFICEDEAVAKSVKEKCEQRVKSQMEVYESYAPEEVERLKGTYLELKGNLVVLCVSGDRSETEKLIDSFLGNK